MGLRLGQMYWDVSANTADFDRGMQHVDRSASQAADSASGSFRRIAESAMGFLVAQAIPAVLNGFKSLVAGASESYGAYERLTLSLEQIAKRDVMDAATIEHRNVVGQRAVELTAAQVEKLEDLRLKRETMAAQMQEESERHRQLIERYGEEGLAVITHSAKMAEMQERYGDVTGAIAALESQSGQMVDIVKRSTEVIMDENEAKKMAAQISKELLAWQRKLTIESPFTEEGVQNAIKTVSAYGFMTDQAIKLSVETGKITQAQADQDVSLQRVIQAMTDYSAATGRTSREVELIALALGQVKAKGKLAGQEILQLTNAGVNVRKVLAEAFGITTQELVKMQEKGLIPADKAIKAIVESFEEDFGGAAKAQTATWQGLLSTMSDLKKIGLRELFTGTFQAIQPFIADVVGKMADPATTDRIRAFGDALGTKVGMALQFIKNVILGFKSGGIPGLLSALGVNNETVQVLKLVGDTIGDVADRISGYLTFLRDSFEQGGLSGLGEAFQTLFGMASDWWNEGGQQWLTDTVAAAWEWIQKIPLAVGQRVSGWAYGAWESLRNVWEGIYKWWDTEGAAWVTTTADTVWGYVTQLPSKISEKVAGFVASAKLWLVDVWNAAKNWWDTGGGQWVTDTATKVWTYVQQIGGKIGEKLTEGGMNVGLWLVGIWNALNTWWDTDGATWASETAGKISAALTALADFLTGTEVPTWVSSAATWLSPVWMGIAKWWTDKAEPLTQDVLAGIDGWITNDLVPALENTDKTTWAKGVGDALNKGIQESAAYIGTPDVAASIANALFSFFGKAVSDMVGFAPQLLAGLVQSIFGGEESTDIEPATNWMVAVIKGAFDGLIEGLKGGTLGQLIDQIAMSIAELLANALTGGDGIDSTQRRDGKGPIANVGMMAGGALIAGLLGGVTSTATSVITTVRTFVTDNVKKAVDWLTLLWQAGQDIVEGLKKGLKDAGGRFKTWVIDWLKSILPKPILDFLGIHSPSLLFAWIGQQIVAGLTQGLQNSTPEAIEAVSQMIQGVMGAITSVLGATTGLANMQGVLDLETKLDSVFEIIDQVMSRTRELASQYATPAGQELLQRLADFGSTMQSAFGVFQSTLNAAAQMVQVKIEPGDIANADTIFEFVKRMIPEVVELLSSVADQFTDAELVKLARVAELAAMIQGALSSWKAAADTIHDIANYLFQQIGGGEGSQLWTLAEQMFGLIRKLATVVDLIGEEDLLAASVAGEKVQKALTPWKSVIETIGQISEYFYQQIGGGAGQPLNDLANQMFGLIRKLAQVADWIGPDTLALASDAGSKIVAALAPWKAAIAAITAIVEEYEYVQIGGGEESKLALLAQQMFGLVRKIATLAQELGTSTITYAAEVAGLIVAALAPWKIAIDTALAIAAYVPDGLDYQMELLGDFMAAGVLALARVAQEVGVDVLALAAKVGKQFKAALDPWEQAIKVADAMRAFKFTGDLVEKFHRFAKDWAAIIADLITVVDDLNEDGLPLVEAFGNAIGAIAEGLGAALEVALAIPDEWTINTQVWDSFKSWVQSTFLEFYNWLSAWSYDSEGNPIPADDGQINLVAAFGAALSSLMGGLRAALDIVANLPATWAVNTEVWNSFTAWVRSVFTEFYNWITTELVVAVTPEPGGDPGTPGDPTTGMGLVQAFGSALSSLMGGLAAALQFILGFPNAASYPTGEVWTTFRDWVMLVFQEFQTWVVDTFHPEDPNLFGPVASFGQAMQAVFGGLIAALEFFRDIVGWVGMGSTFQDRLATFLTEVKARFLEIATFVDTELDADVLASVSSFGDALGRLAGGLGDALALFTDLADTDPTVFTAEHDFRVRIQALMRSIHEVIDAFWTYIVDENGDLWIPVADDLFDKFDRMLGIMRDALNLFVDLNANNLPTPNDLQTFIGLVIDLFVRLTGAILNAGTGSATGVGQIESNIQGGLLVLGGYTDDFYTMGQNFANALAAGIRSVLGDVTAAGGELGDAAATGTGDALQISSPSKVAMRLGGFFVDGFAGALMAGRQRIAGAVGNLFGGPSFSFNNGMQIDSHKRITVEFVGSAGGGVPLTSGQFDILKNELVWALQRGV